MNQNTSMEELLSSTQGNAGFLPPYVLRKRATSYSVIFNLLGIDSKDVNIEVNETRREIRVMACRKDTKYKKGFYWVFGAPKDAFLLGAKAKFRGGVLEITVPREFKPLLGAFVTPLYAPRYDFLQTKAVC